MTWGKFLIMITLSFYSIYSQDNVSLNINNLDVLVSDSGSIDDQHEMAFEESEVMYGLGFYLSGKLNHQIWGNGVFTPYSDMGDYQNGLFDADPSEGQKIFIISIEDTPFGESWQSWKKAVELGADFYDGDGDGKYVPVDRNNNGIWDNDEDKPDLMGYQTVWCIYSDKKPADDRVWKNNNPLGIEISQTFFAFRDFPLANTIFVRYRIKNSGHVAEVLDSVIFGAASDPDIGHYYGKDLAGCDTLLQSAFAYKIGADSEIGYGDNPPAVMATLLQGPHSYIPDITFRDNNNDGRYTEGIDLPLDSAYLHQGPLLGMMTIPGAKNTPLTAVQAVLRSTPGLGDPANELELRNSLIGGMSTTGQHINVKEFGFGNGAELGDEADNIPPHYMFSGCPVTGQGWLCINPFDFRLILSSGPFNLRSGEEVEIIVAYTAGRGESPTKSITVTKALTEQVLKFYKSNFSNLPLSIGSDESSVTNFGLWQNFPNPFNPRTIIQFSIPHGNVTTLKVYDLLGREIDTLLDEYRPAGIHSKEFDGSHLASGTYIYRLTSGSYIQSRKFVLIK